MKKLLTAMLSVLLCLSFIFAFAACGDKGGSETGGGGSGGTENGGGSAAEDYTEPSAKELQSALDSVGAENIFGDTSMQGWNFGFDTEFDFEFVLANAGIEQKTDADGMYKLSVCKSDNEENGAPTFEFKGAGDVRIFEKLPDVSGDPVSYSVHKFDGRAYNDSEFVYLNGDASLDGVSYIAKEKMSFGDIAGALIPTALTDLENGLNAEQILGACEHYGVKLALNTDDGLKFRFTGSEQTVSVLFKNYVPQGEFFDFKTERVIVYLGLGKDGIFDGLSADIDFTAVSTRIGNKGAEIRTKLTASVKAGDGNVELPDDLHTYPEMNKTSNEVSAEQWAYAFSKEAFRNVTARMVITREGVSQNYIYAFDLKNGVKKAYSYHEKQGVLIGEYVIVNDTNGNTVYANADSKWIVTDLTDSPSDMFDYFFDYIPSDLEYGDFTFNEEEKIYIASNVGISEKFDFSVYFQGGKITYLTAVNDSVSVRIDFSDYDATEITTPVVK